MSETAVAHRDGIAPEDEARGNFYALAARLFAEPPDTGLLASIAGAPPLALDPDAVAAAPHATDLAQAWSALGAASATADLVAATEEFHALFVGVGRSEVSLYASHYLGPQSGRPLAEIRTTLATLGLARRPEKSEYEDHLAVLLEVMRMLVMGDAERPPTDISSQRTFFNRHLDSWACDCCTAIEESPVANYYRRVAQFARSFLVLERDSMAMD
jgi:TorA maturation chaperone TorD